MCRLEKTNQTNQPSFFTDTRKTMRSEQRTTSPAKRFKGCPRLGPWTDTERLDSLQSLWFPQQTAENSKQRRMSASSMPTFSDPTRVPGDMDPCHGGSAASVLQTDLQNRRKRSLMHMKEGEGRRTANGWYWIKTVIHQSDPRTLDCA